MKKILVIEDEVQSREMFLECLEAEGFNVIGAENGFVGIQQVQQHLPDLVICDIKMPELDGYDVLTKLRQDPTTAIIPFIFLTAKSSKADLRQGMQLGADDYITKPSTVDEILAAIATRFQKQAAFQQWYTRWLEQGEGSSTSDTVKSTKPQSIFPECPQLKELFDFIEANYRQSITLCDVAQAVGYSSAYLTSLVRHLTGKTVNRWIVERRIVEARFLLQETDQSIEAIAEAVGYLSIGHFFRQFRQYQETTPQAWRMAQRIQVNSNLN